MDWAEGGASRRLRGVDRLDRLRVQLNLPRGGARVGQGPPATLSLRNAGSGTDERNRIVRHHLGDRGIGRQSLRFAGTHLRRYGINQREAINVSGIRGAELGHYSLLHTGHGCGSAGAVGGGVRDRGHLVLEHDDDPVRDVRGQRSCLRGGQRRLL
jgi:hypothetical protein